MKKPTIIIDTREKKPWKFSEAFKTKKQGLKCGDYSLVGGSTNGIVIERKSIKDLFQTLSEHRGSRARFKKVLTKMKKYKVKLLIIEGTTEDVIRGIKNTNISGHHILQRALYDCMLQGVTPIFCNNEIDARKTAELWLYSFSLYLKS